MTDIENQEEVDHNYDETLNICAGISATQMKILGILSLLSVITIIICFIVFIGVSIVEMFNITHAPIEIYRANSLIQNKS